MGRCVTLGANALQEVWTMALQDKPTAWDQMRTLDTEIKRLQDLVDVDETEIARIQRRLREKRAKLEALKDRLQAVIHGQAVFEGLGLPET